MVNELSVSRNDELSLNIPNNIRFINYTDSNAEVGALISEVNIISKYIDANKIVSKYWNDPDRDRLIIDEITYRIRMLLMSDIRCKLLYHDDVLEIVLFRYQIR